MARITDGILPSGSFPYLTADRYQEIMRLPIAAFNGLNKPEEIPQFECSTIWKQDDRDYIAEHLAQAEIMREQELSYPLSPKYFVDDYTYNEPLILDDKWLIKLGERKTTNISLGAALTLGIETAPNDPVVVTIATTLTDATEIKVYYPGEDVEIHPSSVVITGGNIVIKIPRSRLVDPALNDNREDPLSYYKNANFLNTVDVKRVYYDNALGTQYVWLGGDCLDLSTGIAETTQQAFNKIRNNRLAIVETQPATYNATTGVWTATAFSNRRLPDIIRAKYVSGVRSSIYAEITTARLAHTLMPNKPCSCPTVHQYWQEDIVKGDFMTPYGNSIGAINAWMMDSRQKIGSGGKFPRVRPNTLRVLP